MTSTQELVRVVASRSNGRTTYRYMTREQAAKEGFDVDTAVGRDLAAGVPVARKIHMTPEQKEAFFYQTGRRVETRDECAVVFRETDTRPAERGEACNETFDALKEHAVTGRPLDRRHTLEGMDLYGEYASRERNKFDPHKRFKYHVERIRSQRRQENRE